MKQRGSNNCVSGHTWGMGSANRVVVLPAGIAPLLLLVSLGSPVPVPCLLGLRLGVAGHVQVLAVYHRFVTSQDRVESFRRKDVLVILWWHPSHKCGHLPNSILLAFYMIQGIL